MRHEDTERNRSKPWRSSLWAEELPEKGCPWPGWKATQCNGTAFSVNSGHCCSFPCQDRVWVGKLIPCQVGGAVRAGVWVALPPEEVQDGRRCLQGKSRAAACEPGGNRAKDQKSSGEALPVLEYFPTRHFSPKVF